MRKKPHQCFTRGVLTPDKEIEAPDFLRMLAAQGFHLSCNDEYDTSSSGLEAGMKKEVGHD